MRRLPHSVDTVLAASSAFSVSSVGVRVSIWAGNEINKLLSLIFQDGIISKSKNHPVPEGGWRQRGHAVEKVSETQ